MARALTLKLVFYGPPSSGKTTNIRVLHGSLDPSDTGELVVVNSEIERTLFFDFFASALGQVGRLTVRAEFFAVPGQAYYAETRRLILADVDGVVFVADSRAERLRANVQSLRDLHQQLGKLGIVPEEIPLVMQYNKRDLDDCLPVETLSRVLNQRGVPEVSAIAASGFGVEQTVQRLLDVALARTKARLKGGGT